ncbi:hypothetical protein DL98DRAFT_584004 [Cadophora sp. DSE1049]|nr:hypothetical protein DL98DRAFT_584004 [Cadophora sp. DSE1049]
MANAMKEQLGLNIAIAGTGNIDGMSRSSEETTSAILKQQYPIGGETLIDTAPIIPSITNNDVDTTDQPMSPPTPQPFCDEDPPLSTALNLVPPAPTPPSSADLENQVIPITTDRFTLFPKLPAELRLRVWKEAYPEPRCIEVRFDGTTGGLVVY